MLLASLRPVRPLRSQPYPTLWVMQLNHGLESGYLRIEDDGIRIETTSLADSVTSMLRETLAIQDAGTRANSERLHQANPPTSTPDQCHEVTARRRCSAQQHRFVLARFAALDRSP